MGEIIKVIETAEKYVGAKEGSKKYTELITAFEKSGYKYDGQGCCEVACAFFILALGIKRAKQVIPLINYAEAQAQKWPKGLADRPQPGCLVYFGSNGKANHVEFVCEVKGVEMKTIDGNSNHTVIGRTRMMTDKSIIGYGIPDYAEDKEQLLKTWVDAAIATTTLKRYSSGKLVLWLQEFLQAKGFYDGYLDGVYGTVTEYAVRDYQISNDFPVVDGIAGPYFFTKVLK